MASTVPFQGRVATLEKGHHFNSMKLSAINGEINRMDRDEIVELLSKLSMNITGNKDVLKTRLKNHFKHQMLGKGVSGRRTSYDYLCIIDFEATCKEHNPQDFVHEVIEFPAVLLCTHNRKITNEFQRYCKPTVNPVLSDFCTKLTGITQEQVDKAGTFPTVLKEFISWLNELEMGTLHSCAVVTDGPWDMGRFLVDQCKVSQIQVPRFGKKWINIRRCFSSFYRCGRMSLAHMLERLGLTFEGRQHCGLDDARNIARIAAHLLADGAKLHINEMLYMNKVNNEPVGFGPFKRRTQYNFHESGNDDNDGSNENSTSTGGDGQYRTRCRSTRKTGNTSKAISVEEQLSNLGVDPSLEDSFENMMAERLRLKGGNG